MRAASTLFSILFFAGLLPGQVQMFQRLSAPASVNGKDLPAAFAGGSNSPEFSAADLNNDGTLDLVAFDRAGNVVMTYLNGGATGEVDYTFAPEFACNFPALNDYALLRDFNQDGAADIFCAAHGVSAQEMQVYQGYFENNMLKFKPFIFSYPACPTCDPLFIWYPDLDQPGFFNNLPIATSDVPAVDDVDGDGDLDIVAFPSGSSTNLWWLKNTSVEEGFGTDSLHYVLADQCWGRFYENGMEGCHAQLSPDPNICCTGGCLVGMPPVETRDGLHPGATVNLLDLDDDNDKDLLLGNISNDCLGLMVNGGTPDQAWMVDQDSFQAADVLVNLPRFPGSYLLDADNDGKKDLLVTPNFISGEDRKNVWFYKDVAVTGHKYALQTRSLLTDQMIDIGTLSHPTLVDANADGLLDLVAGNYTAYVPGVIASPSVYLFLNTGTFTAPAFTLEDPDFMDLSDLGPNDYDFATGFGDLDGDGDLDALVGSNLGSVYFFRNNAGPGQPMQLAQEFDPMWEQMDVGAASTPFIFDIDGDGLLDLLMGERNGNVNVFKNTGNAFEPTFAAMPTNPNLGKVNTTAQFELYGYSCPSIVNTPDQGLLLISGAQNGYLRAYKAKIGAVNDTASYPVLSKTWGNIDEGTRSFPTLADLDNDGILEMVVGNFRGGLSLYKTVLQACPAVGTTSPGTDPRNLTLRLSPNPAKQWVRVEVSGEGSSGPLSWRVHDALGRTMLTGKAEGNTIHFSVEDWSPGVYFLEAATKGKLGVVKVLKGQ